MPNILLVEDDESLRGFLVRALRGAGHMVVDYGDGTLAYAGFTPGRFDLLLTDIVMPGMDGIALAKKVEKQDPGVKIVFITGFAAVALDPGAGVPRHSQVLSKPVHLREIVEVVGRLLAA